MAKPTANLKLIAVLIAFIGLLGSVGAWAVTSHSSILDKVDSKIEHRLSISDELYAKNQDMARVEECLKHNQKQIDKIMVKVDKIYEIVNTNR